MNAAQSKHRANHWLGLAAFALPFLMMHASAQAATGAVSGKFTFWNRNGNFCPTTNACVGSLYPQSSFNVALPVSNGSVWILDPAGNLIGNGFTNTSGDFNVSWTAATKPAQIEVRIFPFHRDSRFWFGNTAGQLINNTSGFLNTAASSSAGSPQSIGTRQVGTSAAPDPFYNAYWAAERQWRRTLSIVGVHINNFTGIEIRGFADTIPGFLSPTGSAPTSASVGQTKRVQLDANAGFSPQARVMHELGHLASFLSHPWQNTFNRNWPNMTPLTGGWSVGGAEWGGLAFEEAFATHPGSITFWQDNAVAPTTCLAGQGATCYTAAGNPGVDTNVEQTSFPFSVNNCSTNAANPESRRPLSAMRYLWDIFDNHNDADGDSYTANAGDFWKHLGVLQWYAEGTGASQIDEAWNTARTSLTEPDGRGSTSYSNNYASAFGITTATLRVDNCSPP